MAAAAEACAAGEAGEAGETGEVERPEKPEKASSAVRLRADMNVSVEDDEMDDVDDDDDDDWVRGDGCRPCPANEPDCGVGGEVYSTLLW